MAKQALGPGTLPEGMSVELDEVRLLAVFSWKGGRLELDLPTIAKIARRADIQLRDALEAHDSPSGGAGVGSIRVMLASEGCPETCEITLAAWVTAIRHLEKRVAEAIGESLEEYLHEHTL